MSMRKDRSGVGGFTESLLAISVVTVAVVMPFMMMTINLGVVGGLWFGGNLVIQGEMMVEGGGVGANLA